MKRNEVLDAHMRLVIDRAGDVCGRWSAYQEAREKYGRELEAPGIDPETRERLETLLSDLEICSIVTAYCMGLQDSYLMTQKMNQESFVQNVLEKFSME